MTGVQIIDSDRNCPFDGKRMMLEIGQDDLSGDHKSGLVRMVHICWHCGYSEIDENWKRPKLVTKTGPTMAEKLKAQRLGTEVNVWDFVYPGEVPR